MAICNYPRPVIEKVIKSFWFMKLSALRKIAEYYFARDSQMITQAEYEQAKMFMGVIVKPDAGQIQKAAAACGLDLILPGWRDIMPNRILGPIVERDGPEIGQWRKACLDRDSHRCVRCGAVKNLHVHHICGWAGFSELRIEEDNGETLCGNCHSKEHPKMSKVLFVK
jgi:hypothetical protein